MPWQPRAAKAFRSAWTPAPPPESDVAIVKQRRVNFTPSAGITRIRFTGLLSALAGTPVGEG
jgi:hypothetical protein